MPEYPDTDLPAISHRDAIALIRKHHGSARAAAESVDGAPSFKTLCRRVTDLGLVTVPILVGPDTKEALTELTPEQWDMLESWCLEQAGKEAPESES